MNEPHDPDETKGTGEAGPGETTRPTIDFSSLTADSLVVGLAAAFGKNPGPPRSSLGATRPVLLKEAAGESSLVVTPKSDAMPTKDEAGDRYRLDGEIARGGMGAVLRGRDVDLGRDLAVKVLLEKYANRPDVARRFIEEAQIGGQLQHPGVVPVYDIGRFGDRPFFTMKLVKGQTLSAILGERTDPAADRPRLLGIALQVAQAMAYAHAKGVIHRDLKPANIMVGAFGEVQVMDWGLAKVLAEGGVADEERAARAHQVPDDVTTIRTARSSGSAGSHDTEAGSMLGTPAYMPPEQANGDIAHLDRRADVFGLGAILCEILTGKPPYVGRSGEEVRRKACNGDLAEATARLDACGADHELIALMKECLAAEASDRPKDGQGVADRLSAYLASVQERVQVAERERAVAEAKAIEERRRRKVQLALAASLLALTALGGLGTTYYLQQLAARAAAGQRVIDQVTTLRKQAIDHPDEIGRWEIALAAVEQADPAGDPETRAQLVALQKEIEDGLKAARQDRALLDRLVDIRSSATDDPDGSVRDNEYADAFRAAGIELASLTPAEAGARIRARPPSVVLALAAALDDWAAIRRGKRKDAAQAARLSEAARVADPDPWRIDLRTALDQPDMVARRAALEALSKKANFDDLGPITLQLLGSALNGAGDSALAESVLREAQQRHPRDVWVNYALARALEKQSRGDEAIRFYTAARAIRPETAHELAHALEKRGDYDEAIAAFRDLKGLRPGNARHLLCLSRALKKVGSPEAGEILEAAVVAGREEVRLKPDLASAHTNLGNALADKGQLDEAIACHRKATELDPKDATAHSNLGAVLHDKGRLDEAIACNRKAIELDPTYAGGHYNLGSALYGKGQLDDAIVCYKKAIELDPKFANPHCNLGAALADKGQLDEAVACFKKAIELDPKFAAAHYNLGSALKKKGRLDEAIACYKKAIELDPKYATAHDNLGIVLADKGQLDEAIACYKKAIELDPKYANPHINLAAALMDKGQLDEAIAHLRGAIELDPKVAGAHNNLGNALTAKGQLDEAIACCQKAIALDPKDAKAHNNLGNALQGKGQLDEAIARYNQAIELDPKYAASYSNLGVALKDKGQWDEAVACYKKAIELDPKYATPHHNLGNALSEKVQLDEAIACYKKAIELDPKLAVAHRGLGIALAAKGQLDEAIACCKKAIELDPKLVAARNSLGNALKAKGQLDEAIACYKKAIELDPKSAAAHDGLGIALGSKGQLDEAIACFKKAIEFNPKLAVAHCHLGYALKVKGQVDESIACYKKAIELDPKFATAHFNLGIALRDNGQVDEAIACFKKAIELDPKLAGAHYDLGVVLRAKGQVDEAVAAYEKAIELNPKHAEAHCNLGGVLADQGRFAESLAAYRRGHELGMKQPGWRYPSADWVREAETLAAMEPNLSAFLKGEFQPSDNQERLGLAGVCQFKKLNHTAAGLYAAAFAADPKLADDLKTGRRYNAACHAALAAAGQGEDAAQLDAAEHTRLRRQALDWLRADLTLETRQIESANRAAAQQTLRHWQQDSDLAAIRDAAALAKLPEAERKEWQGLWEEVEALLKRAQGRKP